MALVASAAIKDQRPKTKVLFFSFEHPQHAISDYESANHIRRGTDDGDETKNCAYSVVVRAGRHYRTNEGDAGDRVRRGHEGRVQERWHSRDHQVTKKGGERKNIQRGNQ